MGGRFWEGVCLVAMLVFSGNLPTPKNWHDNGVQLRYNSAPPPKPHESIQAELEEWRLRAEEQRPLAELLANSEKRLQDTTS